MKTNKAEFIYKIGLAFVILISFSACTSTPAPRTEAPQETIVESTSTHIPLETEAPQETEEVNLEIPCTISLWHSFNENEIESLLSVSEAYKDIYPDAEFDFLYSPNFDIKNKYESAAGSGGGPSILVGSGDWGPSFYDSSLIQDISRLSNPELLTEVNSAALSTVNYQETLIGLPLNVKGVLMFRNANIVAEAPGSFSDLINLAQSATTGDLIGAYLDYGLYYSAGLLEAIGGSLMDAEGNPTFNDEKGIEWVEMLVRYEEAGPIEHNDDNDLTLFKEGRVGIIIDDLVNAPDLADAIGNDNLIIDGWPADMSGYVKSDVIYLNSNLTGHDLDCGWSFMEYMLSEEAQEMFSDPTMAGFIPSILGINLSSTLQQQAADAFTRGASLPVLPEMSFYWEPLNFALISVVEFESSPAAALSAAEQAIDENILNLHQE
jgi:arabinogalactan oligomer/maltooligosaccharide transport system substrate-binding protein